MLSIGFDGDEDDRYEECPFCQKCKNEMSLDLWDEWFCFECDKLENIEWEFLLRVNTAARFEMRLSVQDIMLYLVIFFPLIRLDLIIKAMLPLS